MLHLVFLVHSVYTIKQYPLGLAQMKPCSSLKALTDPSMIASLASSRKCSLQGVQSQLENTCRW